MSAWRPTSATLLRRILDCRRHYISTRIRSLMCRYREELRADIKLTPDGEVVTVQPSGTGWPG
jgi:hypothetical protein